MARIPEISPEAMQEYRAGARRRHGEEQRALAARVERAWDIARKAAAELRRTFGIERVMLFGSLVHPGRFSAWSDIDIAAWGLHPRETFRALGVATDCDREIMVNLVDMGACKPALREVIEREGIPI